MAPKRINNKKKVGKTAKIPKQVKPTTLDANAAQYAALLRDPCNGPLVPSVFPGANGALLARFEYDGVISTGATETGAALYFVPNWIRNYAALNAVGFANVPVTADGTSFNLANTVTGWQPGFNFLFTNASAVRCVSACLQATYMGTELNRQGLIAIGSAPAGLFSDVTTTAQLRQASQHVMRVPDKTVEIKWVPAQADMEFVNPSWNTFPQASEYAKNGMFVALNGMAAGYGGLRIRLVAVYEWQPQLNVGLTVQPQFYHSTSRNTIDDVLRTLQKSGDWVFNNALPVARGVMKAAQYLI